LSDERPSNPDNRLTVGESARMTLREWGATIVSIVVGTVVALKEVLPGNSQVHDDLEKANARVTTLEKDDYQSKTDATYLRRDLDEITKRQFDVESRLSRLENGGNRRGN
jgi:hypothetical protein